MLGAVNIVPTGATYVYPLTNPFAVNVNNEGVAGYCGCNPEAANWLFIPNDAAYWEKPH